MTEHSSLCETVRELAVAVIAERRAALTDAGLRTTIEVERWTAKDGSESSELRVAFWRDNAFIDIVEDFIVQDGTPVASLDGLRQWLERSVNAIMEENRGG
ncbi:MAG TPA: hypothetical protein VFY45_26035 [Baekduia sp.]|nr:hypothetical protein [Baekduia sp.]